MLLIMLKLLFMVFPPERMFWEVIGGWADSVLADARGGAWSEG